MTASALYELFSTPADPALLTYGVYDPALVALSVIIAIFSSWMGPHIAGQASANPAQRTIALLTGSLALGSGVWAMHFIGMLAFNLCTRVDSMPRNGRSCRPTPRSAPTSSVNMDRGCWRWRARSR